MAKNFRRNIFKAEQVFIRNSCSYYLNRIVKDIDFRFDGSETIKKDKYVAAKVLTLADGQKIFRFIS